MSQMKPTSSGDSIALVTLYCIGFGSIRSLRIVELSCREPTHLSTAGAIFDSAFDMLGITLRDIAVFALACLAAAVFFVVRTYLTESLFTAPKQPAPQPVKGVNREGSSEVILKGTPPFLGLVASGSPFVGKADTFLRASGLPFKHVAANIRKSPKSKVRYC